MLAGLIIYPIILNIHNNFKKQLNNKNNRNKVQPKVGNIKNNYSSFNINPNLNSSSSSSSNSSLSSSSSSISKSSHKHVDRSNEIYVNHIRDKILREEHDLHKD